MIQILSNGSTWAGEQPRSLEDLLKVLAVYALDPVFARYGNFIVDEGEGWVSFFGNFTGVSHVFNIRTDEPEVIARLTRAIRENQARQELWR